MTHPFRHQGEQEQRCIPSLPPSVLLEPSYSIEMLDFKLKQKKSFSVIKLNNSRLCIYLKEKEKKIGVDEIFCSSCYFNLAATVFFVGVA